MDGVKKDRESKQLYQDPAYKLDDIINGISHLKSQCEGNFNLPPPKKEASPDVNMEDADKKDGDKKAEENGKPAAEDAEMKNEEKPAK